MSSRPKAEDGPAPENLPRATIGRSWQSYLIWLIPLAALGLAAWLLYTTLIATGPTLHIYFKDVQGLQPGNAEVKYRGAQVGTVSSMHLAKDQQSVDVEVSLDRAAADLAREHTLFWIVKPQLSLGQIQGLQTIVSGAYIEAKPGPGKQVTHFQGLSQPPSPEQEKKGFRLVLLADKLGSVQKRTPVYYREVQVGEVLESTFVDGTQALQIPIWINEPCVSVVDTNSKFWDAGGLRVQM